MATEAEPTATDVAAIIRQIREENVTAIFVENITDPRIIEQIGAETGVAIGGTPSIWSSLSDRHGRVPTIPHNDGVEFDRHRRSVVPR